MPGLDLSSPVAVAGVAAASAAAGALLGVALYRRLQRGGSDGNLAGGHPTSTSTSTARADDQALERAVAAAGSDVAALKTLAESPAARALAKPLPDGTVFRSVFGRNLMREIREVAAPGCLVVTMQDLWERFAGDLRGDYMLDCDVGLAETLPGAEGRRPYLVSSLEASYLEGHLSTLARTRGAGAAHDRIGSVVGVGGGQAMDVAKWFAWRLGVPLFQIPTALSVDAMYGHRAAIRFGGNVRYVGYVVPEAVYIDYGIMRAAPRRLNLSGVGDVLCYHTGHHDWALAHARGESKDWPYDPVVVAQARAVLDRLVDNLDDVVAMSDRGVRELATALSYGGAAYHAHGWNPRPVEGFEHLFFYCLEARTGKKFLHGQPVMLGVVLGSLLQSNRAEWVVSVIRRLGLDVRPEAMGVTWTDVEEAVRALPAYCAEEGYMYTVAMTEDMVANHAFFETARALVEATVRDEHA